MSVPGQLPEGAQGREGHAQGFTVILIMSVFYTVKNLDAVTENLVKEQKMRNSISNS